MLVLHAHGGLGLAAHGIHLAIVGVGVVGLVALLGPRFLFEPDSPRDEHERRVLALRASLDPASADPGLAAELNRSVTDLDPTLVATQETWLTRAPALTTVQRVLLPLAVVSSAAAAGVHAAVAPAHFSEATLFGVFFLGSALLQLAWAGAAALGTSRPLLLAGVVGNLGVVALWLVTRTVGLPFGLLPTPEAVGPWDLACAAWELVVVASCVAMLRAPGTLPVRLGTWRHWHALLPAYVAGSVLLLVALSFSGAGA
jgi:hypothetical protein